MWFVEDQLEIVNEASRILLGLFTRFSLDLDTTAKLKTAKRSELERKLRKFFS